MFDRIYLQNEKNEVLRADRRTQLARPNQYSNLDSYHGSLSYFYNSLPSKTSRNRGQYNISSVTLQMSVSLNTKFRFFLAFIILFTSYYTIIYTIYRASLIGFLNAGTQNPVRNFEELKESLK